MRRIKAIQSVIFVAAIAMGGCGQQQQPVVNHGEEFPADSQVSSVTKIAEAQADRGARSDATLYAIHFDGRYLNTLGMAKLDRMLRDQADPPVEVWLAVPADEQLNARQMSVAAYLKDRGLPTDEVKFGKGANPATDSPAAQGLKDLPKADQDSSGISSGGAPSAGSAASGSGGGSAGGGM
jgi:uncharacterized membrane protein YgcG